MTKGRSLRGAAIASVLIIAMIGRADAIVIRHDRDETAHQSLAVGREQAVELSERGGAGGATLSAPTWLLTAAHVAAHKSVGQTVTVGGAAYDVIQIPKSGFAAERAELSSTITLMTDPSIPFRARLLALQRTV